MEAVGTHGEANANPARPPSSAELRAAVLGALACAAVALVAGCDAGSPDRQPVDAPPVHLLKVTAKGVDATGNVVDVSIAPDGSTKNVASITGLHLTFDRFLLPATALRQAGCLQAPGPVASNDDCLNGRVFFAPSYDPTRRQLDIWQVDTDGTPTKSLAPATEYQLTLFVPPDEPCLPPGDLRNECFGVRAFDGAPLEAKPQTPIIYLFTTSTTEPAGVPVEAQKSGEDYYCEFDCTNKCQTDAAACMACPATPPCDPTAKNCFDVDACVAKCGTPVQQVLSGCAFSPCHRPGATVDATKASVDIGAAEGLDLESEATTKATAINRVAHETETGEHAAQADSNPLRFGRAMPIIDPGNPGNSYLVYKLLANPAIGADAETRRLRRAIVVGMPMPPSNSPAIAAKDVERISAWIAAGANLPTTPCP